MRIEDAQSVTCLEILEDVCFTSCRADNLKHRRPAGEQTADNIWRGVMFTVGH